jgi:hypothetical protein
MANRRARRVPVPEEILTEDDLSAPSYTCAFEIALQPTDTRTAEEWLRAMFEGARPALRSFILAGWVSALRLRLGPRPSAEHVIGWRIRSATPDEIVIGIEGPLVFAHQVLRIQEGKVVHVTIVHFERSGAGLIWGVAAPIHVRTIPHLMQQASART